MSLLASLVGGSETRTVHLTNAHVRPYLAAMDVLVLPAVAVETFSNAAGWPVNYAAWHHLVARQYLG